MNILHVTPYVPSCVRTRPYNLIRALVRLGHRVTLLTAAGISAEEQAQAAELRERGIRVEVFPVSTARSLSNCLRALPTRQPLQAAYAYHPEMEKRLSGLLQEDALDIVHIEHLRAARLVRAVKNTPVVYDSVDCIALLFEQASRDGARFRSRLMTAIDLARTRRYEAWLLTQYTHVVVTSQRDREALEALGRRYLAPEARPAAITVVTNGVDLEYFRPQDNSKRQEKTVVFTGKMSYHANVAAALYFAREVLPCIWAQDPEVRFQIVGKSPPEAVRRLAADRRIQVTGTVDDMRPYLAQAAVAVCSAQYTVGVQNKVLEAMAMGAPVVSTPAGCSALTVVAEQGILMAEGEEALAAAILRILSDPVLGKRLGAAGRRYVETHHSWEDKARRLEAIYELARSRAGGEVGRSTC
jgi:sugar transferase (PEP-CTERM/EpsH1 system associated)